MDTDCADWIGDVAQRCSPHGIPWRLLFVVASAWVTGQASSFGLRVCVGLLAFSVFRSFAWHTRVRRGMVLWLHALICVLAHFVSIIDKGLTSQVVLCHSCCPFDCHQGCRVLVTQVIEMIGPLWVDAPVVGICRQFDARPSLVDGAPPVVFMSHFIYNSTTKAPVI